MDPFKVFSRPSKFWIHKWCLVCKDFIRFIPCVGNGSVNSVLWTVNHYKKCNTTWLEPILSFVEPKECPVLGGYKM